MGLLLLLCLLGFHNVRIRALECLTALSSPRPCPDYKMSVHSAGLLKCMDDCLTSGHRGICRAMQWDVKKRRCYTHTKAVAFSREEGNCLSFIRYCRNPGPSDFLCMDNVPNHTFKGGTEIQGITNEVNCRIICTIWMSCKGVTWNSEHHICSVHEETQSNNIIPARGDVVSVKASCCRHPCLNLVRRTLKRLSLWKCMSLLLNKEVVNFDYHRRECYIVKERKTPKYIYGRQSKLHIDRSKDELCSLNRSDVCNRIYRGQEMTDGVLTHTEITETECFNVCKAVSNCAGATFREAKGGQCYFHRFHGTRRNVLRSVCLTIIPCRSVVNLNPFTISGSYFIKTLDIRSMTSDNLANSPDILANDANNHPTFTSILECAALCQREEKCQAFSYKTVTDKSTCVINPGSEIKFIRI